MPYTYEYPRPALTVDCVVFGVDEEGLKLLLVQRGHEPFKDCWALPGGFVDMAETTDAAALRELSEETGTQEVYLEQLYTFSAVDRDPRERVVSVAYYALVKPSDLSIEAGSDAKDVRWFNARELPTLAFDHKEIVQVGLSRLAGKVRYMPVGFELLPKKFTLGQLQKMYEYILGRSLDKRNFRRAFLKMGILEALEEYQTGVAHRPSQLFRFNRREYQRLVKAGFSFEI